MWIEGLPGVHTTPAASLKQYDLQPSWSHSDKELSFPVHRTLYLHLLPVPLPKAANFVSVKAPSNPS